MQGDQGNKIIPLRTNTIEVSFTEEEFEALERQAKNAEKDPEDFLRESVLKWAESYGIVNDSEGDLGA